MGWFDARCGCSFAMERGGKTTLLASGKLLWLACWRTARPVVFIVADDAMSVFPSQTVESSVSTRYVFDESWPHWHIKHPWSRWERGKMLSQ
jgi:hypothetical protein